MTDAEFLVLGGSAFVGRAVVSRALAEGHRVTTLNRGSRSDVPGVSPLRADRNDAAAVAAVLAGRQFDAVIDVSGLAPAQVRATCAALAGATPHYTYVSTVSTYSSAAYDVPSGHVIGEDAPTDSVDPDDPGAPDMAVYGPQKRAGEAVVTREFGPDHSLIARPGLILGPYENVHRVPYWLGRVAAGGSMIAPGRPSRPFQFVDVDDLAGWLVRASLARTSGTFNAVNPPGRDTWQDWLDACCQVTGSTARPTWVDDAVLLGMGVPTAWGLPMWFGSDLPLMSDQRIRAAGFQARPLHATVRAAWEWLRNEPNPHGGYRPAPISRDRELRLLAALERRR